MCCRFGWDGNGCDGLGIQGQNRHVCVGRAVDQSPTTTTTTVATVSAAIAATTTTSTTSTTAARTTSAPPVENYGKDCWGGCGHKQGPCQWCGSEGMCCRFGWDGNGCDGLGIQGQNRHVCVGRAAGQSPTTTTTTVATTITALAATTATSLASTSQPTAGEEGQPVAQPETSMTSTTTTASCRNHQGGPCWPSSEGMEKYEYMMVVERLQDPPPPPPYTPVPPPGFPTVGKSIIEGNEVKVDKNHYTLGEEIRVSFVRKNPQQARYPDALYIFNAKYLKPGRFVLNRFASWALNTCHGRLLKNNKTMGPWACKRNPPSDGTVVFKSEPHQQLKPGCYMVGLYSYSRPTLGGRVCATSSVFSVGEPGMTTCRLPPWTKISSQADMAILGKANGFKATAFRYAIDAFPWSPFGGTQTDGDEGRLQESTIDTPYWMGPGTYYGPYGLYKYYFSVRRSDGYRGVIWQDKVGNRGWTQGDIKVSWVSPDHKEMSTTTIYRRNSAVGRASLKAVAFDGDEAMILIRTNLDGKVLRLLHMDMFTMEITQQGTHISPSVFGLKGAQATSIAWSEGAVAMVMQGNFIPSHQGAKLGVVNATHIEKVKFQRFVSSHNAGNEAGKFSDGSFWSTALGDQYPRGIKLTRVDAKGSGRSVVPYKYKNVKQNDNNCYSTLARPGVEETTDGVLLFFTGENPSLDMTKKGGTLAKQVGYVKLSKDLSEVLSGDNVEWGRFEMLGGWANLTQKGVKWLTNYPEEQTWLNAFNLKTASLGQGRILLYWELWSKDTYQKSQVMVVDEDASIVEGPWSLTERMAAGWSDNMYVERSHNKTFIFTGDCEWNCPINAKGFPEYRGALANTKCIRTKCYMVQYELCAGANCA
eukprot:TRINITY_DN6671_c0_g2_i8.p1 TRINITY_DN6671_c0_g2~~TRINITY_DN6671_c0_g2_i8.p1  ORF type:complete len:871 (-),score=95.55 TRINITY_DN6671_c0_g2_i8:91-2703(-)